MTFLIGLLPAFLQSFFGFLGKAQDTKVIESNNAKDVSVAIVQADAAHQQAVKDVTLAMMSHPIFWVAWALGVFPVLLYHASIFWSSTFPAWGWVILRVPDVELEYAGTIVGSVFMLTGVSTVMSSIASAWLKKA